MPSGLVIIAFNTSLYNLQYYSSGGITIQQGDVAD